MSSTDLKLDQLESMASDLRRKRSELFDHVNRRRDERDKINESSRKMRDGIELSGHGWGHGVGMCQWGAVGRAEAGQDYRRILRAYYSGAEVVKIY